MSKLEDHLSAVRRRLLVGRSSALALFESALSAASLDQAASARVFCNKFATPCQAANLILIRLATGTDCLTGAHEPATTG